MIRRIAVYALGQLRDVRAVDALIAQLRDATDEGVCANGAWALGQLRDARAVDPPIAALRDEDWPARANAAMALGRLRDSHALQPLRASLADPILPQWFSRQGRPLRNWRRRGREEALHPY